MKGDASSMRDAMARAVALHKGGRLKEAETLYRSVLARVPSDPRVLNLLGLLCTQDGRLDEAIELMGRALKVAPNDPNALFNYGRALQDADRNVEALAAYERALRLRAGWPEVLNNRGNVLRRLDRIEEALASYRLALQARPDYVAALSNCGSALRQLRRVDESIAVYRRLAEIAPDAPLELGWHLHVQLQNCDWTDYDALVTRTEAAAARSKPLSEPWPFIGWSTSNRLQQLCCEAYVAERWPAPKTPTQPLRAAQGRGHDRIRVAWIADGFRNSVEAQTMVELFEQQDRTRFETFGVSLSKDDGSAARARMTLAFEHFFDGYGVSEAEIGRWLREREIDIALAVTPEMGNWRGGIIARRVAPVQVNFGFRGTLPAYFDYTIADVFSVPPEALAFYREGVVRLPSPWLSYYPADQRPAGVPSRAEAGLPEQGFVLCAFNASYKIQPPMFDVWMRLLRDIEGSVLWLRADYPKVAENLAREAERRGVPASRLVFAPSVSFEEHIARYGAADLFIDSFPYGAHTTTCEALSAGLPVVTCAGETMVSRIAGGLVRRAGLPELVAADLSGFEALVRDLAAAPDRLRKLRARLKERLDAGTVFSAKVYCRELEGALLHMLERQTRGLRPESFDVPPAR